MSQLVSDAAEAALAGGAVRRCFAAGPPDVAWAVSSVEGNTLDCAPALADAGGQMAALVLAVAEDSAAEVGGRVARVAFRVLLDAVQRAPELATDVAEGAVVADVGG